MPLGLSFQARAKVFPTPTPPGRARNVRVEIGQRLPLAEAARAHRELEARRTIGATVLLP